AEPTSETVLLSPESAAPARILVLVGAADSQTHEKGNTMHCISGRWGGILGPAAILLPPLLAQPPALPPIAPNQARLAQTISGLDGPGFALAYSEHSGILAAACERGTIPYWHKDVLMGIRTGEDTPNLLQGHTGPVLALAWNGGPLLASAGADQKVLVWNP